MAYTCNYQALGRANVERGKQFEVRGCKRAVLGRNAFSRGVSRISASGPIRKVGGGGAIRFRSDTKSGGGGHFASGPIRKVERGGGGADTFVWHKENTLSLIINGYSFDQGGCSSTSHARANELKCRF